MWPVLWVPRTNKYSELWGWGDGLRCKLIVWPVLQAEGWMGSEETWVLSGSCAKGNVLALVVFDSWRICFQV